MAWETSESVPEVVEKLRRVAKAKNTQSMSKDIVLSRASSYRSLGVNLKKMKRKHGKPIDVKALNNLDKWWDKQLQTKCYFRYFKDITQE